MLIVHLLLLIITAFIIWWHLVWWRRFVWWWQVRVTWDWNSAFNFLSGCVVWFITFFWFNLLSFILYQMVPISSTNSSWNSFSFGPVTLILNREFKLCSFRHYRMVNLINLSWLKNLSKATFYWGAHSLIINFIFIICLKLPTSLIQTTQQSF